MTERTENRWQKHYRETLYKGKMPRTKIGRREYELLGKVRDQITVHFPDFDSPRGFKPAYDRTFLVTLNDCNMPKGRISVEVLASNLDLWESRGYKIDY